VLDIKLDEENCVGRILISSPGNPMDNLWGSVILLTHIIDGMVIGLRINHRMDGIELGGIMRNLGFRGVKGGVYYGGMNNPVRLHIVHSDDWGSETSVDVCRGVRVTSDVSILDALSRGCGPSVYRACAGYWRWDLGVLSAQVEGGGEYLHRWGVVNGNRRSVFGGDGREQWRRLLRGVVRNQVDRWV
jgi:putative AlgH/UPF0301 family transcriptional regulator